MKKLLCVITITAGIFIAAGLGFADEPGETLTLTQARELALSNSRSLANAALSVQSSELTQKTQYYSLLPTVKLGADASAALWDEKGFTKDIVKGITAGASLSVSESIPLWDGGKYSITKTLNSLSSETARQDMQEKYYSVLSSVDKAYYDALKAQASLEAAELSLETAALSLSIAEIRRQNNMISEGSYLQALAQKENQTHSRNESRRSLTTAQLSLKRLLGLDTLPELAPIDFSALEGLIAALENLDDSGYQRIYDAFWQDITSRNPALIKAGISTTKAEQSLKQATAGYSPTLTAGASIALGYDMIKGAFTTSGKVSLGLSIPLEFWKTAADVEKSKIALSQSTLSYQDAWETLDTQLQTALVNLISPAGQMVSATRALEYAQKNFDYNLELYRLNQNSLSSLTEAEKTLRDSRNTLTNTQYSLLNAISTLRSLGAFERDDEIIALLTGEGSR